MHGIEWSSIPVAVGMLFVITDQFPGIIAQSYHIYILVFFRVIEGIHPVMIPVAMRIHSILILRTGRIFCIM